MTDKTPLLTDKEIDQIHLEEWSDDGEYRIVLRVARRVQTLVAERAAAAERAACATECWKIAMDPTASQQYRLGANACFDRLRARDPL